MSRSRLGGALAIAACLAVPDAIAAQQPVAQPKSILTVNPLGFLQLGPTVEFEWLASPTVGIDVGLRSPTLGLLAHLIDPELGLSLLGIGSVRFHTDSRRPLGWWLGPRAEAGKSSSGGTMYDAWGGGIEFGHSRRLKSGRILQLGAMGGRFESKSGFEAYFIMGALSIGRLF